MSPQQRVRKTFQLTPTTPHAKFTSYRLECLVEGCQRPGLGLWDYHRNALAKGYAHAHLAHGLDCTRGLIHAKSRMFQEPQGIETPIDEDKRLLP